MPIRLGGASAALSQDFPARRPAKYACPSDKCPLCRPVLLIHRWEPKLIRTYSDMDAFFCEGTRPFFIMRIGRRNCSFTCIAFAQKWSRLHFRLVFDLLTASSCDCYTFFTRSREQFAC